MEHLTMTAALADRLFEGLIEVDARGVVKVWNRAAERITGYGSSVVLNKPYSEQPARHVAEGGAQLADPAIPLLQTARDGGPRETIGYFLHSSGYRVITLTRTEPIFDRRKKLVGAAELFTDNRTLIAAFQALQRSGETVLFDPLTGIGNRLHIEGQIRAALTDYHVHQCPFGLLFIDIDHFKEFNDTYGHLIGDKVLRVTANALRHNLRASDSCGRWGGEEFVALVHDLDEFRLATVAEKLRGAIAATRLVEGTQELGITVSLGGSLVRPTDSLESLLERADQLMYESKRAGRNRVLTDALPLAAR